MSEATNEPDIMHVWICAIHGTERELSARATRKRAERWVEDRIGDGGEWIESQGAKDFYRTSGETSKNGMVALAPLPDCVGMIIPES